MDKIQELEQRIAKLEQQPIQIPLDPVSTQALMQALISTYYEKFNVANIFLTTGNSVNPSLEGQIVYHENSGSPVLKVYIDGTVKTFTLV